MAGLDSLSATQKSLLKQMGVTLWHARHVQAAASIPPEPLLEQRPMPPAEAPSAAPAVSKPITERGGAPADEAEAPAEALDRAEAPIAFAWLSGSAGLLIHEPAEESGLRFFADVVAYMDWRCRAEARAPRRGFYRWPQLETSRGSPERPLRAFFKQHPERWCIVDDEMGQRLASLGVLPEGALRVEDLGRIYLQADRKRALWAKLRD